MDARRARLKMAEQGRRLDIEPGPYPQGIQVARVPRSEPNVNQDHPLNYSLSAAGEWLKTLLLKRAADVLVYSVGSPP